MGISSINITGGGGGAIPNPLPVTIGAPIEIQNDLGNPVPISGVVGIGNFPATQPISGNVNVGNFPAVQNVQIALGSGTLSGAGLKAFDPTTYSENVLEMSFSGALNFGTTNWGWLLIGNLTSTQNMRVDQATAVLNQSAARTVAGQVLECGLMWLTAPPANQNIDLNTLAPFPLVDSPFVKPRVELPVDTTRVATVVVTTDVQAVHKKGKCVLADGLPSGARSLIFYWRKRSGAVPPVDASNYALNLVCRAGQPVNT